MASISELSVGKILTVYHHGIEKKLHYDGLKINSERDIKSVLQIEQGYTRWKIYSKLADHQQHFLNQS